MSTGRQGRQGGPVAEYHRAVHQADSEVEFRNLVLDQERRSTNRHLFPFRASPLALALSHPLSADSPDSCGLHKS